MVNSQDDDLPVFLTVVRLGVAAASATCIAPRCCTATAAATCFCGCCFCCCCRSSAAAAAFPLAAAAALPWQLPELLPELLLPNHRCRCCGCWFRACYCNTAGPGCSTRFTCQRLLQRVCLLTATSVLGAGC